MNGYIPIFQPDIGELEKKYVAETLDAVQLSGHGKQVGLFEERFADHIGSKYAVMTSSGTTALHLACAVLNISRGDEVIIPQHTIIATAYGVVYQGANVVAVDSTMTDWNIDPDRISAAVTGRTRAIIPVHIYGPVCNMDRIMDIADKYSLWVIEDSCEALGSTYRGRKAGALGHIGIFSYFPNKLLTTGEGGMLVTDDEWVANRAKYLRNMAYGTGVNRWIHQGIGFNYRPTSLSAALGLAQLERISELTKRRLEIHNWYIRYIPTGFVTQMHQVECNPVWWANVFLCPPKIDRNDLILYLEKNGIETRPTFPPLSYQPALKGRVLWSSGENAELIGKNGIILPSGGNHLTEDVIKYICEKMAEFAMTKIYEIESRG